jgi:hypothetical protein
VVAADAATAALKTRAAASAISVFMDTSTSPGLTDCGIAVATHAARDPETFALFPANEKRLHKQKLRSSPRNKFAVSDLISTDGLPASRRPGAADCGELCEAADAITQIVAHPDSLPTSLGGKVFHRRSAQALTITFAFGYGL